MHTYSFNMTYYTITVVKNSGLEANGKGVCCY